MLLELSSFFSLVGFSFVVDEDAPSGLCVAGFNGLWSHTDRLIVQPGTFEKRSLRCKTFLAPKSQTPSCAPVTMCAPERSPMDVSVYSIGAVLTWEKFFHLIGSNQRLSCSSGPCHLGAPMATCASQCGWRIFGRDTRCCKWTASRFCLLPSKLSLRPVTGLRPIVTCTPHRSSIGERDISKLMFSQKESSLNK
uniref:Secreted protein n=1 Tax=Rhizophora mucronata TaxID=61149 RepID=A0A2P2K2Y2_RHIMU